MEFLRKNPGLSRKCGNPEQTALSTSLLKNPDLGPTSDHYDNQNFNRQNFN